MGLRLRRTPVIVTRTLLGLAAMTAIAAPPIAGLLAHKTAHATSTPDISKIHYDVSTTYVRENNDSDTAAQLVTYKSTTAVQFYIDGNTENPVAGSKYGAEDEDFGRWQLHTVLAAGSHTVTAKVTIDGEQYDVPGAVTVYSLDVPTADYVLPTADQQVFRPTTNPLRISVDNEFNQLKSVTFSLYSYDSDTKTVGDHIDDFTVSRAKCTPDDTAQRMLCNASDADNWKSLGEGVYIAKLQTTTFAANGIQTDREEYWKQFGIDATAPALGDLRIDGATTVKDSLPVSINASDANGVESVDFYVTALDSNGTCMADGAMLVERRVNNVSSDGRYHATLDVSGIATHNLPSVPYCVYAVARDKAMNTSDPTDAGFFVDHMAPVVTLKVTSSSKPSASTPITLSGTVDGYATLELFRDGVKVPDFVLSMDAAGQWSYRFDEGLDKGEHVIRVIATDQYGNSSSDFSSPQSFTVLVVSAYVPPKAESTLSASLTPPKLTQTLVATPSVAQMIASRHAADAAKRTDEAVLGAETENATPTANGVIATSSSGWTFFGVLWYWWLLLGALLAAGASRVVKYRRIGGYA